MTTYFCDGLKEVTVLNGVARLEFHRLQGATPTGNGHGLESVTELIIALPPQGLLQILGVLEQARQRLVQNGLLPQPGEIGSQREAPQQKSPNFA